MRCFLELTPEYLNLLSCMHNIYNLLNNEERGILDSYCAYIAEHSYHSSEFTSIELDNDAVFYKKEV
jgi:hypothetical protein